MLKEWSILESETVLQTKWFSIIKDRCETPEGEIVPEYYTWHKPDCVIVFPVTTDKKILLIRQYRHGLQRICLDYPGGTVDEGLTVIEAARAELLEETGYRAKTLTSIGSYAMDSSYSNQMAHFVVATGCEKVSETSHPQEVTEVVEISNSELADAVGEEIDCVLCALFTKKGLDYLAGI
jgi:ADP-ribose pyrophosphatase